MIEQISVGEEASTIAHKWIDALIVVWTMRVQFFANASEGDWTEKDNFELIFLNSLPNQSKNLLANDFIVGFVHVRWKLSE